MTGTDLIKIIPIVSLLIVVAGWFINNWLNRKHEIAKKRNEYRVNTLRSFIGISKKLNFRQSEFCPDEMLNVQIDFLIFGFKDEVELVNRLVDCLSNKKLEEASNILPELSSLVRDRLRKELGFPKNA